MLSKRPPKPKITPQIAVINVNTDERITQKGQLRVRLCLSRATNGRGRLSRGAGVAFAFALFLSYREMGFLGGRPQRSRARGFCACIGAKQRPLNARTGRTKLVSEGKGALFGYKEKRVRATLKKG